MTARSRLLVALPPLLAVWAASFTTDRLPFFPTVLVGASLAGVSGWWIRRAPDHPVSGRVRVAGDIGIGLIVALVHFGLGHALFRLAAAVVPTMVASGEVVVGRTGEVPLLVAVLLAAVVTAPAEELLWRGAVHPLVGQRAAGEGTRAVATRIALSAAAYTAFHLVTGQPALVAAAALAGLVWGWLYERRGLAATIVAHAAWTGLMVIAPPV